MGVQVPGGRRRVRVSRVAGAGQPEPAADDPLPAAERQPADPDGRAGSDRDHLAYGRETRQDIDHVRARTDRDGPPIGRWSDRRTSSGVAAITIARGRTSSNRGSYTKRAT